MIGLYQHLFHENILSDGSTLSELFTTPREGGHAALRRDIGRLAKVVPPTFPIESDGNANLWFDLNQVLPMVSC